MKIYAKLSLQPTVELTIASYAAWAMGTDGEMVIMPGDDTLYPVFTGYTIMDHSDSVASLQSTFAPDIRDHFNTNVLTPINWIVEYSI